MINQIGMRSQHDQPTAWLQNLETALDKKGIKVFFALASLIKLSQALFKRVVEINTVWRIANYGRIAPIWRIHQKVAMLEHRPATARKSTYQPGQADKQSLQIDVEAVQVV